MPDAARDKYLMFRIGYNCSQAPPERQAATPSKFLLSKWTRGFRCRGDYALINRRYRLEFRIDNGNYEPRLRERLWLERTFKAGRFGLTPYGYAEAYYESDYRCWAVFRYTGGLEWAITRLSGFCIDITHDRETEPKNVLYQRM